MPPFLNLDNLEALVQLALAVILSAVLGLEREHRGRAAGLRTLILVCLGATVVMIVAQRISAMPGDRPDVIRVDPGRIPAGIVTGIGFLGGGVILKLDTVIRGVTTAATIWFVAALGIVIGHGDYALAVGSTLVALFVLTLLKYPERLIESRVYRNVELTVAGRETADALARAQELFERREAKIIDIRAAYDSTADQTRLTFVVRTTQQVQGPSVVHALSEIEGVSKAIWR